MKDNIEQIIEEFRLSKEDLLEIEKMMHDRSAHLSSADDWAQAYVTEFYVCSKGYIENKPKHL